MNLRKFRRDSEPCESRGPSADGRCRIQPVQRPGHAVVVILEQVAGIDAETIGPQRLQGRDFLPALPSFSSGLQPVDRLVVSEVPMGVKPDDGGIVPVPISGEGVHPAFVDVFAGRTRTDDEDAPGACIRAA